MYKETRQEIIRPEIHITHESEVNNLLMNQVKLSKTTISALWKSNTKLQLTEKHIFVKNMEL